MPPQPQPDDQFVDPAFPVLGIDLTRPFAIQRDGTTFIGDNVRAFEPDTNRGRGGSRPGLSRFISEQVPAGPELLQLLTVVVRADGVALLANYDDQAPDLYDPSSVGPPDSWPPGRFTRTPALPIPNGGWGIPPWKGAPVTPNIVWPDPAAIAIGTALSGLQLNAVARDRQTSDVVPGSYLYYPVSGTELPLGLAQELFVTFTPTDTTRYRIRTATAHIDVIQSSDQSIEYVQEASGAGSSIEDGFLTFGSDVESGNLVVMVFQSSPSSASGELSGVTDSQGNSWTKIVDRTDPIDPSGEEYIALWYTVTSSSGPLTISLQFDFSQTGHAMAAALEYRNTAASPLQSSNSNSGSREDLTWTTGSMTVTDNNRLIFAAFFENDGIVSVGSGYTERAGSSSLVIIERTDADSSQAATVEADGSGSPSIPYQAVGAVFKPEF